MIRQRLLFAALLVAVVSVALDGGEAHARRRCCRQNGRGNSSYGYSQTGYAAAPFGQSAQMTSPTLAMPPANPGVDPTAPPAQAPAPAK